MIQIEGEEVKPAEAVTAVDPKLAAAAKKPPPAQAKPDPKKAGALDEITDNRPRIISYVKDFAAEGGPMKITEDVAKRFAETMIRVEVVEVNRETQEESMRDSVCIDLSCLLYPSKPNLEFVWMFDKMKPMSLHYLQIKI